MENFYLDPSKHTQAGHVSFGFGRRICVGKDLATESLFIDTVRILWAAKLERARDDNGKEVVLDIETIVDAGAVLVSIRFSGGFIFG